MIDRHCDIAGMVLAGGKSTRMKRNKALLNVEGVSFVERIVETLEQRFSRICISANCPDEYAFLEYPIVPDVFEDSGPLAGIHAVMKSERTEYLFVVTCDIPFINTDVIDTIIDKRESDKILIADDGLRSHYLVGLYPRIILEELEKFLERDGRQVGVFINSVNHKTVDVSAFSYALKNINTAEEYEKEIGT